MSPEQKQKALEIANATKNNLVTLWKSGKKGKAIIIGCAVVILGVMGQIFGGGESSPVSQDGDAQKSASAAQKKDDPLEVDKSYLKNASEDTAKANNDVVPVIKGTSIMTIARDTDKWSKEYKELAQKYNGHGSNRNDGELGLPVSYRRSVERLYKEGFYTPVTYDKAKVDPSRARYSLFGGTLKIGDTIDLPAEVASDYTKYSFNAEYAGKSVIFNIDEITAYGARSEDGNVSRVFPDKSQVWKMEYDVKEFMGLRHAETKWYRAGDSNKLVLFWAEVKNRDAGDSKQARETRAKFETAIKGKYPDMEKTYRDKVTDEFMMNGDILELMQSPVSEEGGWLDAPYIKVAMITPSIVDKLLKVIDEMIKQDFESFKKKDQGALDNF